MAATRQQGVLEIGAPLISDTRQVSPSMSGWNAGSITPGPLPIPPGFLTPEQVVEQAKTFTPTVKTFSAADFLTQPAQLNDPKLASRPFSSVPTTTPTYSPVSVSAYSNTPVPAFLTNAVNQLNQSQAAQASQQAEMRNKLLNAVLSGNYLAAEALRASVVSPGAAVGFGQAVQNPQVGQAQVIAAQAQQKTSQAVTDALQGKPTPTQTMLQQQLADVSKMLANTPSNLGFGPERAKLSQKQFDIQRELENLQNVGGAKINLYA